jgi:hypothetical protein
VTGDICFRTRYGPYLRGLSFLEGVLTLRLCASNHTLSLMTKDLGKFSGLMRLCNAFCALDLDSCTCFNHSCAAGTESSGVSIDAMRLIPVISS